MTSSRLPLFALGLAVLAAVAFAIFTYREEDRWFDENGAPPIPPVIPENARPVLVASAPLPRGPAFTLTKPVIAAEPNRLTVVAQAVSDRPLASALVQWHAVDDANWSEPTLIPNWPKNATFVGDPWMDSDRRGRVDLVHTSLHDGILVFRRSTQAKGLFVKRLKNWDQWNEPQRLSNPAAEEIRMPALSSYGSMVHLTWLERKKGRWQAYYRGSSNQGLTWSDPLILSVPNPGSALIDKQGFALTSDDDQSSVTEDGAGTVHAVWAVRGLPTKSAGRIWHAKIHWQAPS